MEPWTHETLTQLRGATHRGDSSLALDLLRSHPVLDVAHTISPWLIHSIEADVPGARWHGMAIVESLRTGGQPGDSVLATRLQHALDGREPPHLTLVPIDLSILSYILEGGHSDSQGYRLNVHTGQILSEDPEGYDGVAEPPDWEDREVWLEFGELWPRRGWQDMADFIETIEDPDLAERLAYAIRGKGAFRRFNDIVYSTEYGSRWGLFRDERETGRARHWLSEQGLRPD